MTSYAVVEAKSGTFSWIGLPDADTLGRYERGANAVRVLAAQALHNLIEAQPQLGNVEVWHDNAPGPIAGPTLVLYSPGATEFAVSVQWREATSRGRAGAQRTAYRFTGVLQISILEPRAIGDGVLTEALDFLANELRYADEGEVHLEVPSVAQGSANISGADRPARTLSVPFYLDEANDVDFGSAGAQVEHDGIAEVCRSRFQDEVATPLGIAANYDNAPWEQPDAPWAAVSVLFGDSQLTTFGVPGERYVTRGILQVQIHVAAGVGASDALAIADAFFDAFHSIADRGVLFSTPEVRASTRVGPYWQVLAQVPFSAETIR